MVMSNNDKKQPNTESKWESGCQTAAGIFWGSCLLIHLLSKIDTPEERKVLVLSIIVFIVVFVSIWQAEDLGCAWVPATIAVASIWVVYLWIAPFLSECVKAIREWIEHG